MKKLIVLLLLVSLFFSCSYNNSRESESNIIKETESSHKLTQILDDFIGYNPDCFNNDITLNTCDSTLNSIFQNFRGKDIAEITENIPLKFIGMTQYQNSDSYLVEFAFDEKHHKTKLSTYYQVRFNVLSILQKGDASKLINNRLYLLNGVNKGTIDRKGTFTLPNGKTIEAPIKIREGYTRHVSFDLGYFEVDNLIFELF